jgi:hypothetical protein
MSNHNQPNWRHVLVSLYDDLDLVHDSATEDALLAVEPLLLLFAEIEKTGPKTLADTEPGQRLLLSAVSQ